MLNQSKAAATIPLRYLAQSGRISRLAIRSKSHDLVLGAIGGESQIDRDEHIKESQTVLILLFVCHLQVTMADPTDRGVQVLSFAVHTKKSRALEGRSIEGSGDMREMMPRIVKFRVR